MYTYICVAILCIFVPCHTGYRHSCPFNGLLNSRKVTSCRDSVGDNSFTSNNDEIVSGIKTVSQSRDSSGGTVSRSIDYNWKHGIQTHNLIFEGIEVIRKLKLINNTLLFGDSTGRLCTINVETSEILSKYHQHASEITALDYSTKCNKICSGCESGVILVNDIVHDSSYSNSLNNPLYAYKDHKKDILGLKILEDLNVVVSCSMDKRVIGYDLETGSLLYDILLQTAPMCIDGTGDYFAVGLKNGRVQCYNAKSGKRILEFDVHPGNQVTSILFRNSSMILTGSSNGEVKLVDLSGDVDSGSGGSSTTPSTATTTTTSINDKPVVFNRPTRFIDYYFMDIIAQQNMQHMQDDNVAALPAETEDINMDDNQPIKRFYPPVKMDKYTVVALQADDSKVVAGYSDGSIIIFDINSRKWNFNITGRTSLMTSLQFNDYVLIADGTNNLIISHDFRSK